MQTKPEMEVGALCGAVQAPLLRRDQLVPGVMITGIAPDHVHGVQNVEGDVIVLQRLPRQAEYAGPGHTHSFTQYGNTTCVCGLSRRPVGVQFLPEDGVTPRFFILQPQGELSLPDQYSVYLLGSAQVRTLVIGGGSETATPTGSELPIICRAHNVWTLPVPLRQVLELAPVSGPLEADEE